MTKVTLNAILSPTPECVIRHQEREHLIYNPKTDEMHLIQPTGYFIYQLCDGLRTVTELVDVLEETGGDDHASPKTAVIEFLNKLVQRGVLQVDGYV